MDLSRYIKLFLCWWRDLKNKKTEKRRDSPTREGELVFSPLVFSFFLSKKEGKYRKLNTSLPVCEHAVGKT